MSNEKKSKPELKDQSTEKNFQHEDKGLDVMQELEKEKLLLLLVKN